jgi:hypothetical protein
VRVSNAPTWRAVAFRLQTQEYVSAGNFPRQLKTCCQIDKTAFVTALSWLEASRVLGPQVVLLPGLEQEPPVVQLQAREP